MLATTRRTGLLLAALGAFVVLALAGAAVIYDQSRKDRLADGLKIDGVPVGGLSREQARGKLAHEAVAPRRRALVVHAGTRTFTVPASRLRVTVDLDAALDRAVAKTRSGWIGSRVVHDLTGRRLDEDLPLISSAAPGVVAHVASVVARGVGRAPRDAAVAPNAGGLDIKRSRPGRSVDTAGLRRALTAAIADPRRPADVDATVRSVPAKTTFKDLARKYRA